MLNIEILLKGDRKMKHMKHIVTITVAIIAFGAIFMGVRHMIQKPCDQENVIQDLRIKN